MVQSGFSILKAEAFALAADCVERGYSDFAGFGRQQFADPETPVGARGVGEPPVGAGYGAVLNAIADAVGEDVFRRAPVTADIILMSLENGRRMHEPLRTHV